MQTIYYRNILIRYCSLTHKKRFCDKESFRCEKNELFVKTCYLAGEFSYGGRVTKCFTVNLLFKMQTIYYRDILIRYCSSTHKNTKNVFVIKKVLDVKKMSYLSKLAIWQVKFHMGGRVAKCLTVNLFFMIQTILCRYILIRYCRLTHKKCFCKKKKY